MVKSSPELAELPRAKKSEIEFVVSQPPARKETGGDGISVWKGHNWTGPGPSDREDYCPNTRNVECACENLLVRDVVCDRNYRQVTKQKRLSQTAQSALEHGRV